MTSGFILDQAWTKMRRWAWCGHAGVRVTLGDAGEVVPSSGFNRGWGSNFWCVCFFFFSLKPNRKVSFLDGVEKISKHYL